MPFLNWNESYSVKVTACDLQHQKLFYLINALHEAMQAGKGRDYAHVIVRELHNYAKSHFTAEEALLERTKYSHLSEHRAEHRRFISDVGKFERDIAEGRPISLSLMDFLRDWLIHHVTGMDKDYSDHLNGNGIV